MGNVAGLVQEAVALGDAERVQLLGTILEKEGSLGLSRMLAALETKFGVKASTGGGSASGPATQGPAKAEAPTAFDVILEERRREQDQRHQGRARGDGPGPQGGEGSRRRRAAKR